MATDPAVQAAHQAWRELANAMESYWDSPSIDETIDVVVAAVTPLIRAQAFTEAAAAVQAERMPDPPTEEMRSRVDYWRGYDAAIFDAGEAVRGLGEETENARERR